MIWKINQRPIDSRDHRFKHWVNCYPELSRNNLDGNTVCDHDPTEYLNADGTTSKFNERYLRYENCRFNSYREAVGIFKRKFPNAVLVRTYKDCSFKWTCFEV